MSNNFFYKLGHCQDLAIEEYFQLTGDASFTTDEGWLIGKENTNVNLSGGLVFGGEVLSQLDRSDDRMLKQILGEILQNLQQTAENNKKIGIVLPKKLQNMGLDLAKRAGFKKVNVSVRLPNFGSWKSTKNWIILFEFQKSYYFGRVVSFSNQEFWAMLDQSLPHGDIEQGIMNLKLGRSLLNLTKKESIFDPFCGQGRLMAAGFDLKKAFLMTDILPESPAETKGNYEKSEKIWNWGHKFLQTPAFTNPALETGVLDARNIKTVNSKLLRNPADLAIVTEGHLGKNFQVIPTVTEIQSELSKLFDLWKEVLKECRQTQIPEVIFCLPLYLRSKETGDKWIWPKYEDKLVENTGYRLQKFATGKSNILYSRPNGYVGHLILKAVLA